ncbi:response regulator [Oceanibacterium hippocampi]|uniref:Regulatory protein VirG n=1 Tax=Oceanibacterium hippocampi TaxID=745714 RepID=A0A1Y5RV55_9PROT|nr:response regulator transcription factor [Oceanibacterium hippocampi]SLN25798.1 Transcriptional regulatory protein OmpR [Oceanibacterium hippocampi]
MTQSDPTKRDIRVLIVEDDADLRLMVATFLSSEDMAVVEAASARDMWRRLDEDDIDFMLLDVNLPDADGIELLGTLRGRSEVPVIMITAYDTPMDRIRGLEIGADDYIGKPFELRELLARMRSVLRRYAPAPTPKESGGILGFGQWTLDLTRRRLADAADREITLTSGEFDLLRCLAQSANIPLSRDQLMDLTRSRDWTPYDRSIDVLIGRLRKKIETNPNTPELIKTVRGIGYVLAAPVSRLD